MSKEVISKSENETLSKLEIALTALNRMHDLNKKNKNIDFILELGVDSLMDNTYGYAHLPLTKNGKEIAEEEYGNISPWLCEIPTSVKDILKL
ncbi:MAG: hypothetical protein AABX59_01360 [Nanoarchaeota archaeon]